ncbi:hypothetical protein [Streptomyces calvus]|uniref:hypothetical protein n=1 Tax=Streptomyces calvus TaxID=67282 RepID=UPI001ABEFF13|nr:hypothetical protein [Streptomyces calvus]
MFMMSALPDVPRRIVLAAHAVPLVTLPSALWRLALAAGVPVSEVSVDSAPQALYIVCLAVFSEVLALLTLGLVRPWGEVVPRWVPLLGGRAVRPLAAAVPAVLGGVVLAVLLSWAFYRHTTAVGLEGTGATAQYALLLVCYIPLLAWPPLLITVTVAYHRRRTAAAARSGGPAASGGARGERDGNPEAEPAVRRRHAVSG